MTYWLLTCFPAFQSGSEEETFVFPNGNGSEHSKGQTSSDSDAEAATLSDRSTQTDPVDWTPVAKQKDRLPSQKKHPPLEKVFPWSTFLFCFFFTASMVDIFKKCIG